MDRFRVTATGAGVSYYPEFLARELGYFADENLDVVTEAPGHGPYVARAIASGTADAALGGIWRPLMYRNRLDRFYAFAQLCINCSTRIISRGPIEHFTWASFLGKRVVIPDGSPTPWMLQDAVIRRAGVDPMKILFIRDFLSAEATALFRGGLGDFILAGPPAAEQLVDDGVGVRVACLCEAGRVPWSVYYSTPEFLNRDDNLAGRFTKAITRALRWILTHDPTEAPSVFAKHFPQYGPELVAAAVRACREEGAWTDTARLDPSALNYWQEMIVEAALIDAPYGYSDIFDSRAVDWAEAQLAR